jgi:hypothetical protein
MSSSEPDRPDASPTEHGNGSRPYLLEQKDRAVNQRGTVPS